jgi:hypothetical protein
MIYEIKLDHTQVDLVSRPIVLFSLNWQFYLHRFQQNNWRL